MKQKRYLKVVKQTIASAYLCDIDIGLHVGVVVEFVKEYDDFYIVRLGYNVKVFSRIYKRSKKQYWFIVKKTHLEEIKNEKV